MGSVTFETVQISLVLQMTKGAVLAAVGARMGLHFTVLLGMTGDTGCFCLCRLSEIYNQGFMRLMTGVAVAHCVMGRIIGRMTIGALRNARLSMLLMTVRAGYLGLMGGTQFRHLTSRLLMT